MNFLHSSHPHLIFFLLWNFCADKLLSKGNKLNLIDFYFNAKQLNQNPFLLEFQDVSSNELLKICALKPKKTLEVRENKLFLNKKHVGPALAIFDHLTLPKNQKFFPAFLGFFSYEFSHYFGKEVHQGKRDFPDAFFQLFDEGVVFLGDQLIEKNLSASPQEKFQKTSLAKQELIPHFSKTQFFSAIETVKKQIKKGDVYQVNLSQPLFFSRKKECELNLYSALKELNPSPYMGMVSHDDWKIISASPERLFALKENILSARPIAGTKKRGKNNSAEFALLNDLQTCKKENAEHAMLVDLMRNDLNQVCKPASVRVSEDRSVEFYSHVMHLVSNVEGQCDKSLQEIFRALFPGGTITGAPKASVMKSIAELEACPRGPYTGSLGYISSGFGVDFNILIRTILCKKDRAWVNAGAGIVIDSDPKQEWLEVLKKAQATADILKGSITPKKPRATLLGPNVEREINGQDFSSCQVFFLEGNDSFSFNIVDALRSLGAKVFVSNQMPKDFSQFSHGIIGPGPGNPAHLDNFSFMIEWFLKKQKPLLGICLGHQAIGNFFGADIVETKFPHHGKVSQISHQGEGIFANLESPLPFARYHSLALKNLPDTFNVDAMSSDDHIMAIRHKTLAIFGLQFHPESYLSRLGQRLLENFLATS